MKRYTYKVEVLVTGYTQIEAKNEKQAKVKLEKNIRLLDPEDIGFYSPDHYNSLDYEDNWEETIQSLELIKTEKV